MIVEIECVPRPLGTPDDPYRHVEAAIAEARASGLRAEVHALGTVLEGPPDLLWPLLRRVHEAALASGAEGVLTVVKVSQGADPAGEATIDDLTAKFR